MSPWFYLAKRAVPLNTILDSIEKHLSLDFVTRWTFGEFDPRPLLTVGAAGECAIMYSPSPVLCSIAFYELYLIGHWAACIVLSILQNWWPQVAAGDPEHLQFDIKSETIVLEVMSASISSTGTSAITGPFRRG